MSERNDLVNTFIGIDLGAKAGFALIEEFPTGELKYTVVEIESPKKHPLRHYFFYEDVRSRLEECSQSPANRLCGVYYEDVKRHIGTLAAHAYGAYKMLLLMACHELNLDHPIPLGVGTIKKEATGKGNATKEMMIESAIIIFGLNYEPTDNQADALHIAELGRLNYWKDRNGI